MPASLLLLALLLAAAVLPASASASKQAVDFFGGMGSFGGQFGNTGQVAINYSGAGGVPPGTLYVTDTGCCPGNELGNEQSPGDRLNRFQREDNGTPADTTDDTYTFVSTWGAGIEGAGTNYQICTVAANCEPGVGIGGNGTLGGNGSFNEPTGVAVDQDTGEVYVADTFTTANGNAGGNYRVNVYSAIGTFLRSFGWDVVESGPGDNGAGYEVCVAADGDICKSGVPGSGLGQIDSYQASGVAVSPPDGNPATGTIFLGNGAINGNQRVNTYNLDGSSPGAIGSAAVFEGANPAALAVDSRGILYASNVGQIERYDTQNANGGGIGFLSPISGSTNGLAVDPDSDGPGPDSDVLYSIGQGVRQFGPLNPPGLTTPPSAADDTHGTTYQYDSNIRSLAVEPPTGRLYVALSIGTATVPFGMGVIVLDETGPTPTASLDSFSDITASSAIAHATIDPNGPPNTNYHFEYSTDQVGWTEGPTTLLGHQEDPQSIEEKIGWGPGLHPSTHYYVRLIVERNFTAAVTTPVLDFTTAASSPIVETTGSPIRTAGSALLSGRVTPRNSATEYHFEYGDQGPCNANPCTATEPQSAGSGDVEVLVGEQIEELQSNTTYHYRVIADNGNPPGPVVGEDMTVTTRASDAALSHGRFPGPGGSDRAYEQVSLPDAGGNPVFGGLAVSDDGNRAFYRVSGGTPLSGQGSLMTPLYAERIETAPHQGGWQSQNVFPAREELVGSAWLEPGGTADLSEQIFQNSDTTSGAVAIWRIRPGQQPTRLLQPANADFYGPVAASEDASRVVTVLKGAHDPAHTPPNNNPNLYDISSGTPELIGLMPDGTVPGCGSEVVGVTANNVSRAPHWVSDDGSLVLFKSCSRLYLRDLVAEETKSVASVASLVKSTPGAVFFITNQSLVPDDLGNFDLYRYDLGDETYRCITCIAVGLSVGANSFAVAEDGSRVYFTSPVALLPGAATPGIYRVKVASGDLAYVGAKANVGDSSEAGQAITPDGSSLIFASSDPGFNALGGQQNGGTLQFYRYDDDDRSLTCLSCPQNGGVPANPASVKLIGGGFTDDAGANRTAISRDGSTIAFATPNTLLPTDQNTARPGQKASVGTDVYEWRDGRLLLVTDGLTNWPDGGPVVQSVTPSGRDIFFTAAKQYTQDAPDGYARLYTARIGGGFEVPPPPKPCPLEVCQGIPKGAPEEQEPGSGNFSGPGNKVATPPARRSCPKGRHKARKAGETRCVKSRGKKGKAQQKKRQRTRHDRRAQR